MSCFDDQGRCFAYIFWLFILVGIAADLFCQYDELEFLSNEKPYAPGAAIFMALSSGLPLFRVFGAHISVKCVHVLLSFLPAGVILCTWNQVGVLSGSILLGVLGFQIVSACCFFCFCQGHTPHSYAWRVGLHALCGILALVYYYIICCFFIKPEGRPGSDSIEAFYILLLLTMLLTPSCQAPNQAIPLAELERKEFIAELKEKRRIMIKKEKEETSPKKRVTPTKPGKKNEV